MATPQPRQYTPTEQELTQLLVTELLSSVVTRLTPYRESRRQLTQTFISVVTNSAFPFNGVYSVACLCPYSQLIPSRIASQDVILREFATEHNNKKKPAKTMGNMAKKTVKTCYDTQD